MTHGGGLLLQKDRKFTLGPTLTLGRSYLPLGKGTKPTHGGLCIVTRQKPSAAREGPVSLMIVKTLH